MSGKLTKGNPYDCFIDTCIYIDYGLPAPFSDFNTEATDFFNSAHRKYTSYSVTIEINRFKGFMHQFQIQLEGALNRRERKSIIKIPQTIFTGYNDSRWPLIEKLIGMIKNRNDKEMASLYREFRKLVIDTIDDGLAKTANPIEPVSKDQAFVQSLEYIKDTDDQQIIADAVVWATRFDQALFCTIDRNHILKNGPTLTAKCAAKVGRHCLIFMHVKDM